MPSCPALTELAERLTLNKVPAHSHAVAHAILAVAHEHRWIEHPERAVEWLTQLALDVTRAPPTTQQP